MYNSFRRFRKITFKELNNNYPIILKLSQGIVNKINVMFKLKVKENLKYYCSNDINIEKKLPLIIQEFIELEYDIRGPSDAYDKIAR